MARMTKREFEGYFRSEVLPMVIDQYEQDGIVDKPARREAWNDTVDAYIADGILPESAGNWSHPKWLEKKRFPNPGKRKKNQSVSKSKVKETYRKHYRRTRDWSAAWNATLDDLAGPYKKSSGGETRRKVADYLRQVSDDVLREEGDPFTLMLDRTIKALKADKVLKILDKKYDESIKEMKAQGMTEEEIQDAPTEYPILYLEFDDRGELTDWVIEHSQYYRGHAGPTVAIFPGMDYGDVEREIGNILAEEVQENPISPRMQGALAAGGGSLIGGVSGALVGGAGGAFLGSVVGGAAGGYLGSDEDEKRGGAIGGGIGGALGPLGSGVGAYIGTYEGNPSPEFTELLLYLDNDGEIYRTRTIPVIKNLVRKKIKGTYDPSKAPQAWKYVVEDAAKKYAREFASPGEWNKIFDVQTRREVATYLAGRFDEEYEMGEWDHIVEEVSPKSRRRNPAELVKRVEVNPRRKKRKH